MQKPQGQQRDSVGLQRRQSQQASSSARQQQQQQTPPLQSQSLQQPPPLPPPPPHHVQLQNPLPIPIHSNPTTQQAIGGVRTSPHTGTPSESLPPSRQTPTVHSTYSPPGLQPGPQPPPQPPPGSATGPSTRTGPILNPITGNPNAPTGIPPVTIGTNRAMVPGPPLNIASPPDRSEISTSAAATAVARARSTSSRLSPEPALTLLPEDQRAVGHGARRPFQRRRRSRACDACRMRKTKCDTPDAGPCASCVAASLVCKFSEGGDERRRVGPARKLRALESEVQVLKTELERERQNKQMLRVDPMRPPLGPMPIWPQPGSRDQFGGFGPTGTTPMRPELQFSPQEGGLMGFPPLGSMLPMPPPNTGGAEGFVPMSGVPTDDKSTLQPGLQGPSPMRQKRYSTDSEAEMAAGQQGGSVGKRIRSEESSWGGQYYGSTSAPSFANNYREFVEQLGFAPPVNTVFNPNLPGLYSSPMGRLTQEQFPLLSDNPSTVTTSSGAIMENGGDLRRFFPPREVSEKLKEAFRATVQRFTPMFYWPILETTWEKAFSEPIFENDREKLHEHFCVIMMIMAVGSQVSANEDQFEGASGYNSNLQGCLSGWKFFELARKFHNLNNPVYTLADCTIFILMSLYLDGASLPSPTWMLVGATGRVCQDIGLHKALPSGARSRTDIECRNRLLWTAFILDQKLALTLGRPAIFRPETIEVSLPGMLDNEGTGCDDEDPTATMNGWSGDDRALATFRANVNICRHIQKVTELKLTGGGQQGDVNKLLSIDDHLRSAWAEFPPEYTDPRSREPLEIPALRPLCNSQHARLSLFRSFSDFSTPLSPTFRTFCLSNSIIISKFTAHLLTRCSYTPNFETEFALRTNDLVHIHVFRAATILLLAYHLKMENNPSSQQQASPQFQNVDYCELNICISALKSAANRHPAANRYFGVFREFARLFNLDLRLSSSRNSPTPGHQGDMAFSAGSGEGSPGDFGVFSAQGSGLYSNTDNPGMMGGGQGGSGSGGIDMSQVMNVQGDGLDWDAMRDMMENDAGFGNMMSGNVNTASQQTMLPTPSSGGLGSTGGGMVGGMMGTNTPGLAVMGEVSEGGGSGQHGVRPPPSGSMGHPMGSGTGVQTGWEGM